MFLQHARARVQARTVTEKHLDTRLGLLLLREVLVEDAGLVVQAIGGFVFQHHFAHSLDEGAPLRLPVRHRSLLIYCQNVNLFFGTFLSTSLPLFLQFAHFYVS